MYSSGSLTGDELTLNDKSYSIKDSNGNDFYLGKLITREKWFFLLFMDHIQITIIFFSLKICQLLYFDYIKLKYIYKNTNTIYIRYKFNNHF